MSCKPGPMMAPLPHQSGILSWILILLAFTGACCCPDGWLLTPKNTCIKFVDDPKTWSEAEAACQSEGAHLVSIHSQQENQFIYEQLLTLSGSLPFESWWLGLSDPNADDAFIWSNGKDANIFYWHGSATFDGVNCAYVNSIQTSFTNTWLTGACSNQNRYICVQPLDGSTCISAGSPANCEMCTGTEGGAPCTCAAGWRGANCDIAGHGSNCAGTGDPPNCICSGGGLACTCQSGWMGPLCYMDNSGVDCAATDNPAHCLCSGTSVSYPCTCAEGWRGAQCEIATCCPDGWLSFNDSCYRFVDDDPKNWQMAEMACIDEGAHLTSIHSLYEQNFVLAQLDDMGYWWHGLNDIEQEGEYKWSDGSPLDIVLWAEGEPNNLEDNEDCGIFRKELYQDKWNDANCATPRLYICKRAGLCSSNPCLNEGICSAINCTHHSCTCAAGYTGTNCETDIDECQSAPCENGGICTDGIDSYSCACVAGYTGINCETNIDECQPDPCENGGICTDGIDSYNCECVAGYTGTNCEKDIDECESNPCENGGTCTHGIDSYSCTYVPGHTGTNCETAFCCPDGWKRTPKNTCIKFVDDPKTWSEAEAACQSEGAHLVSIHSQQENQFIYEQLLTLSGGLPFESWWLGLSDSNADNAFIWSNGKDANIFYWHGSATFDGVNCVYANLVQTSFTNQWLTGACSDQNRYICVQPLDGSTCISAGSPANCETCTGAGAGAPCTCAAGWRGANCDIAGHGSDCTGTGDPPNCICSGSGSACTCQSGWMGPLCYMDNSGVDCAATDNPAHCLCSGTSVSDPCTCAEGWRGAQCEIATCCPDGWLSFNDSCYRFVDDDPKNWQMAEMACMDAGAHLTSIHSLYEQNFVLAQLDEMGYWWHGLNDIEQEGEYKWSDGSPLDIVLWAEGEPNNLEDNEDCGIFRKELYQDKWNDANCATPRLYICKRAGLCSSNPCLNEGICSAINCTHHSCTCAGGYTGTNCETDIDECQSDPCENGGICTHGIDSYSCACVAGCTGINCETNTGGHGPEAQRNRGSCTHGIDVKLVGWILLNVLYSTWNGVE